MLSCAEQAQIQKYKTRAYKTLKTADVQTNHTFVCSACLQRHGRRYTTSRYDSIIVIKCVCAVCASATGEEGTMPLTIIT